jgi:hypothetical protein
VRQLAFLGGEVLMLMGIAAAVRWRRPALSTRKSIIMVGSSATNYLILRSASKCLDSCFGFTLRVVFRASITD